eukprot:69245-Rhodomonas_salina.2
MGCCVLEHHLARRGAGRAHRCSGGGAGAGGARQGGAACKASVGRRAARAGGPEPEGAGESGGRERGRGADASGDGERDDAPVEAGPVCGEDADAEAQEQAAWALGLAPQVRPLRDLGRLGGRALVTSCSCFGAASERRVLSGHCARPRLRRACSSWRAGALSCWAARHPALESKNRVRMHRRRLLRVFRPCPQLAKSWIPPRALTSNSNFNSGPGVNVLRVRESRDVEVMASDETRKAHSGLSPGFPRACCIACIRA